MPLSPNNELLTTQEILRLVHPCTGPLIIPALIMLLITGALTKGACCACRAHQTCCDVHIWLLWCTQYQHILPCIETTFRVLSTAVR